jgi:membrane-associated phospholipid phosphatase
MRFRRSELFFSAFFIYAAGVALARPIPQETRTFIVTLNLALLFWFGLFAWAHAGRGFVLLDHVRDWYPVPLILLAYREMGWMALPHTSLAFEDAWIGWDRWLLGHGFRAAVEAFGPVGPNLLELAYLLVYVVPVAGLVVLYWRGARDRVDDYFSILLFGTLTAYALYPWFPSEPPRLVFPEADLPRMTLLRTLNLKILGEYGIHTSVFPSGHAAAAFSAAFALLRVLPKQRRHGWRMLALAVLIAAGTVYGRYHFAVDTLAGFLLASLAWAVSLSWRGPQPASNPSSRGWRIR